MGGVGFESIQLGLIIVILFFVILLIVLSTKFKTFGKMMGAIFLILGLVAIVYGINRSNSWGSQLSIYANNEEEEILLLACYILGGISTVVGIIFIVIGFSGMKKPATYNYNQAPVNYNPTPTTYDQTSENYNEPPVENSANKYIVKVRCSKCQMLNDETSNFCNVCGNLIGNQENN